MRKILKSCLTWLSAFGIEPLKSVSAFKNLPVTLSEYGSIKRQNLALKDRWKISLASPFFHDRKDVGGIASGHYFHQDLHVARKIYQRNPNKHVDVGSRVDGFVAHVAVFRKIEVFDIRPITADVPNIKFAQRDLMNLDADMTDYCDSLSCLHALEHFGLGRYGDPIDAEGYAKGFEVLTRMLKPSGILYLSVPIGSERVEFNGQRVFSIRRIVDLYRDDFELIGFSYVDDAGNLCLDLPDVNLGIEDDFGLNYGCGIFELKKKSMEGKLL